MRRCAFAAVIGLRGCLKSPTRWRSTHPAPFPPCLFGRSSQLLRCVTGPAADPAGARRTFVGERSPLSSPWRLPRRVFQRRGGSLRRCSGKWAAGPARSLETGGVLHQPSHAAPSNSNRLAASTLALRSAGLKQGQLPAGQARGACRPHRLAPAAAAARAPLRRRSAGCRMPHTCRPCPLLQYMWKQQAALDGQRPINGLGLPVAAPLYPPRWTH